MEKYLFIFRGGDLSHLSPEQQQAQMQKWFAWVEKLQQSEQYIAGEPLLPNGVTVSGKSKIKTDGPFAEGKELVGGFFMVSAKDLAEATAMAGDYPDFELDGSIEIRPVMKLDM